MRVEPEAGLTVAGAMPSLASPGLAAAPPPTTPFNIRPRPAGSGRDQWAAVGMEPSSPPDSPLYFQCPGCRVTLMLRDAADYSGRPAPCPECGAGILPPRVALPLPRPGTEGVPAPGSSEVPPAPESDIIRPDRRRANFEFLPRRRHLLSASEDA